MSEETLSSLITKRGMIKRRLTMASNFVLAFQPGEDLKQAFNRIDMLKSLPSEFFECQSEIEQLEEVLKKPSTADQAEQFDVAYNKVLADLQSLAQNNTSSAAGLNNSNAGMSGSEVAVKLPAINLPIFDGTYCKWISFRDTFRALVDENVTLNGVQKFHYLKSCLVKDASRVIDSLSVSEANYNSAWETLKRRFDNKRLIVQDLLSTILNSPVISKNAQVMLRQLVDSCTISISALNAAGIDTTTWDPILIAIITEKLDYVTRKEWQSTLSTEIPKLAELTEFIEKRCQFLETMQNSKPQFNKEINGFNQNQKTQQLKYNNFNQNRLITNSFKTTLSKSTCGLCQGTHALFQCIEFTNLSVDDRLRFVRSNNVCENCLQQSHQVKDCKSKHGCKICNKLHNSMLHKKAAKVEIDNKVSDVASAVRDNRDTNASGSFATIHTVDEQHLTNVLLPTAIIVTYDSDGKGHLLRALLDSASQLNFMTENASKRLNLKTSDREISVMGINQTIKNINKAASWEIQSCYSKFKMEVSGFIIDQISERLPQFSCNIGDLDLPRGIQLADPKYFESNKVDILLGSNVFFELIGKRKISLGRNKPILQETQLGWVISGTVPTDKQQTFVCNFTTSLQDQVARFWRLEDFGERTPLSSDELLCESIFADTHKRTLDGNYLVKLPLKENYSKPLASTYQVALKRFQMLEKRFEKNSEYKYQYSKVIKEYLDAGHIEKVPKSEIYKTLNVFYLPHHGVVKQDSITTKLRIVFDASCKTSSGASLNEHLLIGPKLQQDLFSILTRFRKHKIVLTADIEKMYFQIWLHPEQRDFQRFFWRTVENDNIEVYRVKKVTFGTASAPYLAVKTLQQLATDEGNKYPLAKTVMLRDFYVDDLLTGADSIDEILEIKGQLTQCLKAGGFTLRKWASNANRVRDIELDQSRQHVDLLGKDSVSKILGMMWDCKTDEFFFSLTLESVHAPPTKRSVLSVIARLYDPLGLINPILVRAKILLQELWIQSLGWDDIIPREMEVLWQNFIYDIENINKIRIPRVVIAVNSPDKIQVHAFCDASVRAYGACIYIRATNDFDISIRLLCAKSRVAPIKRLALPRLELCGALLLTRLLKSVMKTMELPSTEIYCWTDSTIVLNWLATPSNKLDTFVGNRIAEIQGCTLANKWRHIPTELNPADILSRGCSAADLKNNRLWNNGPEFLRSSTDAWPNSAEVILQNFVCSEIRTLGKQKFTVDEWWEALLSKFSKFSKLIRTIAYWRRFLLFLMKNPTDTEPLTPQELDKSTYVVIKHIQKKHFFNELVALQKGDSVVKSSKLITLHPFLDADGLIRVGGRLTNSCLPYRIKHPLVLPKNDIITHLIIVDTHVKHLHAGPQATLAAIREKYWILCGRSVVRQQIYKCVRCFKVKPITSTQLMGNLPKERVEFIRTFFNSAVDYAGPISIKESKGRGKKIIKAYIALFLCLATKSIHLELVTDCTAESFINALKRFMARRGKPAMILSDNATTFKGANEDIKKAIHSEKSKGYTSKLAEDGITWKFIPPRSPHFGGIYEAGIKSIKYHLKRVVGQALLTYEEMYTALSMIEACVNSRPITPLPDSPSELEALTPGHFLIGSALTSPPEQDIQLVAENRLSRWQRVEQLRQHFWKRWQREFVVQLQQRLKWKTTSSQQIRVGDLVVLQEDNLPPLQWNLGRVQEIHPGSDGLIRVVTVKTKSGTLKRAIHKLCVLPINEQQ